jgi:phosphoribosylformylglycinamidine cyclo-ligase
MVFVRGRNRTQNRHCSINVNRGPPNLASTEYKSTGVDYDVLDAAKRKALESASQTKMKYEYGEDIFPHSRGESAYVFKVNGESKLAPVLECLGTKSAIAREYMEAGGPDLFRNVGFDAVAAIVNDLISVGALPLVLNAYFATGSAEWYSDRDRHAHLIAGWSDGCLEAGAAWGGGESPTLSGLINEYDIEIAGSAVGFIPEEREPILGEDLAPGNEIVFVESTGIHTNGASLVRSIANRLPEGYRTKLPSGREFGAAVLDRSALYANMVAEIIKSEDIKVNYYSHITGHGLRKVMRADKSFTYRIESLPEVPEILSEICRFAGMDTRTAYGTLNMGIGFAIYCAEGHGQRIVEIAKRHGRHAEIVGHVEEGPKRVILEPLGIEFNEDELQLRHRPAATTVETRDARAKRR